MGFLGLSRLALTLGAATALLAACGGSQPPIGAPGVVPQSSAIAAHSGSRVLPDVKKGGDLLYVLPEITKKCPGTCVYSYPQGKLVQSLNLSGADVCSDGQGNVFITGQGKYGSEIVEYAHGGTSPIATLSLGQGAEAGGCGLDPGTGNLAVTYYSGGESCRAGVAIFPGAQGTPTTYCDASTLPLHCGYDSEGNLFLLGVSGGDGYVFQELPQDSNTITTITISGLDPYDLEPGRVQWDGSYMALQETSTSTIYRVQVSGSTATIVGTTTFNGLYGAADGASWIQGNRIVLPFKLPGQPAAVGIWSYPGGGDVLKTFKKGLGRKYPTAVAVSVAPK